MVKLYAASLLFFLSSTAALSTDEGTITDAPCLELEHIDGNTKNICDKQDKPYLLLEFFSSRCGHCQRNVPWFKRLEEASAEKAHSRLVSLNTRVEASQFADQFDVVTPIALDLSRSAQSAFKVTHVPTLFVLDATNKIIFSHVGVLNEAIINRIVGLLRSSQEQSNE